MVARARTDDWSKSMAMTMALRWMPILLILGADSLYMCRVVWMLVGTDDARH